MSAVSTARSIGRTEGVDPVRALQRVLYRSAKSDRSRRFHVLFDKVARSDVLRTAWFVVAANRGAAGVDGQSIGDIEAAGVSEFLEALAGELRASAYRPAPLRRVHIPKPGTTGQTRPLGIPTVRDRVVMAAAKIVLEPIFEADFLPVSFGFRPKRSAHDALGAVRQAVSQGRVWVLDADIKACFDEIDHEALMAQVARRVSDRSMSESRVRENRTHGSIGGRWPEDPERSGGKDEKAETQRLHHRSDQQPAAYLTTRLRSPKADR